MVKKYILSALTILLTISASAQQVQIINPSIKEIDGQVAIDFYAEIGKLSTNEKLTITPVLYNDKSFHKLTPIIVYGRNNGVSQKRLSKEVTGVRTTKHQRIPYATKVAYESWMSDVSLRIERKIEGCCSEQLLSAINVVEKRTIRYDIEPIFDGEPIIPQISELEKLKLESPFLYSLNEYRPLIAQKSGNPAKEQRIFEYRGEDLDFDPFKEQGVVTVYFKLAETTVDLSYRDNAKSIAQLKRVLQLIDNDPNAELGRVVIAGTASPEGRVLLNESISRKRAYALKDIIEQSTSDEKVIFDIVNIGEYWSELRALVAESDMPDKELVLETMAKYSVRAGRDLELVKLKAGRPYNYMVKHFFPGLRSAGYIKVYYESKADVDFEATNQAIKLVNEKQYQQALMILKELKSTQTVDNLTGVCYMMTGNHDAAQSLFEKGVAAGSKEAQQNMNQLIKAKSVRK